MVAVASGCKQLMVLEISGCDNITSQTRPGPVEMVASACKHSSHVAQPARLRSKITDAAMEAIALELQERGAGIMLVLYATTLFLARGHTTFYQDLPHLFYFPFRVCKSIQINENLHM